MRVSSRLIEPCSFSSLGRIIHSMGSVPSSAAMVLMKIISKPSVRLRRDRRYISPVGSRPLICCYLPRALCQNASKHTSLVTAITTRASMLSSSQGALRQCCQLRATFVSESAHARWLNVRCGPRTPTFRELPLGLSHHRCTLFNTKVTVDKSPLFQCR